MITGRVFDIQRFSIHDGPGIRTTVFLQGCPLNCLWCGNPESISPQPVLSYDAERCIRCAACVPVCPERALTLPRSGPAALSRPPCTACGRCVAVCAPHALELVGELRSVPDVLQIVLRDRDYYQASGGGLTLSGGEPLFQPAYAQALLEAARQSELHCCVETSGYAPWGALADLLPLVDLWLYDYKETDSVKHEAFTGKPNRLILENLARLHAHGAAIRLRCPMIPQHNARTEHLEGIVTLSRRLPNLEAVELLPYYDLWRAKLARFGLTPRLNASVRPPDAQTVHAWQQFLRDRGVKVLG